MNEQIGNSPSIKSRKPLSHQIGHKVTPPILNPLEAL